jgi:hypothetical protein
MMTTKTTTMARKELYVADDHCMMQRLMSIFAFVETSLDLKCSKTTKKTQMDLIRMTEEAVAAIE